jgi:uncharacterized protein (DUF58 family)
MDEVLAEVRRIEVRARRRATGVMAGGYLSVFRGAGLEFESVREYEPGDDPRRVDWNVTARVGRPFVKTYVDERDLTVLFLVDLSASMQAGYGVLSARQTAARVVASLALSAVQHGDRVGLVAFSDRVDAYVAPRKGRPHALRLVRDCLALPAGGTKTDMKPALQLAVRALRRHAVVFLLSDFLGEGWQKPLGACARRHDVVAVRLLAPELEAPRRGLLHLADPESGRAAWFDANSPASRAAYAERVAAWRAHVARSLRRARVDLMDVPVPRVRRADDVVQPILRFFRMRELRGRKR